MAPRSSGHATVGFAFAALGVGAVGAGVLKMGIFGQDFLSTPVWAISLTAGTVLGFAGAMILIFAYRAPPEESSITPAHLAFSSRMSVPTILPPLTTPRAALNGEPRSAPAPTRAPVPVPPAPAPATPAGAQIERLAAPRNEMAEINVQIRDLTRRINKAGVMLATGQLSQEGYLAYVEDLKLTRARLEAKRVRYELRS